MEVDKKNNYCNKYALKISERVEKLLQKKKKMIERGKKLLPKKKKKKKMTKR